MIRANIEEERETMMAHFICGLNKDIANAVELHYYVEVEEVIHMAMKVERQLLKRHNRAYNRPTESHSSWKN